jgi:spermidine synthase
MEAEPFREALLRTWRVDDFDGVLAHLMAPVNAARAIAANAPVNTDDRNRVEFGFAKSVGRPTDVSPIFEATRVHARDENVLRGVFRPYGDGDLVGALKAWRALEREPIGITENLIVAEGLAQLGDGRANEHIEQHRAFDTVEADVLLARLHLRQADIAGATRALESAFIAFRRAPWPLTTLMARALSLAEEIAGYDHPMGARLFAALAEPFAVFALDERRLEARVEIARRIEGAASCVEAWEAFEPYVPWSRDKLRDRRDCYVAAGHRRAAAAVSDERDSAKCVGRSASLDCW